MRKTNALHSSISLDQLQALNKTTTRLYRILLRECRLFTSMDEELNQQTKTDENNEKNLLLQQPINPRDWGRARLFASGSINAAHAPKSQIILDFVSAYRSQWINPSDSNSSSAFISPLSSSDNESQIQDTSALVSPMDIFHTIQTSFQISPSKTTHASVEDITHQHRHAIDALRILQLQVSMFHRTCITYDHKRGIRVIATSRCIGKALRSPMAASKGDISNRFAYRIRVENTGIVKDGSSGGRPIQLLGRFWSIQEEGENASEAVEVKAPKTGAVGHLPVIHPGEIFEYMSGCEISTNTGSLSGYFYMADVEEDTQSAMCGENAEALNWNDERTFQMPVGPFRLVKGGDNDYSNN